jgi:hypothetical protein
LYPQINTSRISLEGEISPIPGLDVLDEHRTSLKPDIEENIASLRRHLKYIGAALIQNRDLVMDKATVTRPRTSSSDSNNEPHLAPFPTKTYKKSYTIKDIRQVIDGQIKTITGAPQRI